MINRNKLFETSETPITMRGAFVAATTEFLSAVSAYQPELKRMFEVAGFPPGYPDVVLTEATRLLLMEQQAERASSHASPLDRAEEL